MTITGHVTSILIGPGIESRTAWLACRFPERPPDEHVVYHVLPACHACEVVREAERRREASQGQPR